LSTISSVRAPKEKKTREGRNLSCLGVRRKRKSGKKTSETRLSSGNWGTGPEKSALRKADRGEKKRKKRAGQQSLRKKMGNRKRELGLSGGKVSVTD